MKKIKNNEENAFNNHECFDNTFIASNNNNGVIVHDVSDVIDEVAEEIMNSTDMDDTEIADEDDY